MGFKLTIIPNRTNIVEPIELIALEITLLQIAAVTQFDRTTQAVVAGDLTEVAPRRFKWNLNS